MEIDKVPQVISDLKRLKERPNGLPNRPPYVNTINNVVGVIRN